MGNEVEIFRSYIKSKGLRNTREREEIVQEIFSNTGHFDVEGLYMKLKRRGSKVSKASIYRNIPLLIDSGLIREVSYKDGHMHYEHVHGRAHHCHLSCIECGKVVEFVEPSIKEVEKRLESRYGFKIIEHRLDVMGYCKECLKKRLGKVKEDEKTRRNGNG